MDNYTLDKKDMYKNYFHFTNENNLNSIREKGLLPFVGGNAKHIEKTEKIFFIEGIDNLLILLDCWTNVYYYKPVIPFIYTWGTYLLRQKWFPMIIADGYFGVLKKSKLHRKRAFRELDKILDRNVLLHLELEEGIDFKRDDKDEIKSKNYKKRHLKLMGYSDKYSSVDDDTMDSWNMHMLTGSKVNPQNIKLCILESGQYKLRDIFNYCVENTKIDIQDVCPILYDYLNNWKS